MLRTLTSRLALALMVALLLSCGKGGSRGSGSAGDKARWPAKPADGTPVILQFQKIVGEGKRLAARMEIFNFSDKTVRRLKLNLRYLDKDGKELKTFPWSQMAPALAEAKSTAILKKLGAFLPAETTKVEAVVQEVEFGDGSTWKAPEGK